MTTLSQSAPTSPGYNYRKLRSPKRKRRTPRRKKRGPKSAVSSKADNPLKIKIDLPRPALFYDEWDPQDKITSEIAEPAEPADTPGQHPSISIHKGFEVNNAQSVVPLNRDKMPATALQDKAEKRPGRKAKFPAGKFLCKTSENDLTDAHALQRRIQLLEMLGVDCQELIGGLVPAHSLIELSKRCSSALIYWKQKASKLKLKNKTLSIKLDTQKAEIGIQLLSLQRKCCPDAEPHKDLFGDFLDTKENILGATDKSFSQLIVENLHNPLGQRKPDFSKSESQSILFSPISILENQRVQSEKVLSSDTTTSSRSKSMQRAYSPAGSFWNPLTLGIGLGDGSLEDLAGSSAVIHQRPNPLSLGAVLASPLKGEAKIKDPRSYYPRSPVEDNTTTLPPSITLVNGAFEYRPEEYLRAMRHRSDDRMPMYSERTSIRGNRNVGYIGETSSNERDGIGGTNHNNQQQFRSCSPPYKPKTTEKHIVFGQKRADGTWAEFKPTGRSSAQAFPTTSPKRLRGSVPDVPSRWRQQITPRNNCRRRSAGESSRLGLIGVDAIQRLEPKGLRSPVFDTEDQSSKSSSTSTRTTTSGNPLNDNKEYSHHLHLHSRQIRKICCISE